MKQSAKPVGTQKNETKQSILMEELGKLQKSRETLKEANTKYVGRHPELRTLLDEFSTAVLAEKPADIIKFGARWFGSLRSGGMGFAPLIVTGPSGCGKTTFCEMLLKDYPDLFALPVQTTTRLPKRDETDGIEFHFVDEMQFDEMKNEEKFIHWWPVMQNFYGLTVAAVEEVHDDKKICLIETTMDTISSFKASPLDCKYFFIAPPNLDVLEKRLKSSQKYNAPQIEERMEAATLQMEEGMDDTMYDQVVINEDKMRSYVDLVSVIASWYVSADISLPALNSDEKSGGGTTSSDNKSKASTNASRKSRK